MTAADDDDDLFAAEYVLGTLEDAERQEAARRSDAEPAFAQRIEAWSVRLAPLIEGIPAATPGVDLWPRILRQLGWEEAATAPSALILNFQRRIRRWQVATGAAAALAAGLAAVTVVAVTGRPAPATATLVAVLQPNDAAPAYLIKADLRDRELLVRALAAKPPEGRVFELWMIDPSLGAPRSLGVLPDTSGARPLPAGIPPDVAARATYAISVEPPGGSPTGQPSGTPVLVGHLMPT